MCCVSNQLECLYVVNSILMASGDFSILPLKYLPLRLTKKRNNLEALSFTMRLNLNLFSIFQITVVTTGWISLAFTFRGNPIGSDIIVGWVGESSEAALIVSATFNFSTQMAEKLANKYLKKNY